MWEKTVENTLADNSRLDGEVVVPLKYLSKYLRFIDFSLIYLESICL